MQSPTSQDFPLQMHLIICPIVVNQKEPSNQVKTAEQRIINQVQWINNCQQFQNLNRTLMKLRNNSKSKEKLKVPHTLTVTLELPMKKITIKAPNPCPGVTLKQLLKRQLQQIYTKIAYFQTSYSDWLTDYKIQSAVGWIKTDITLKCIMKKNGAQVASGIDAYTILKCIGVGGFSKVYLVRDKTDGTFYAAKFIEKVKLIQKHDLITNEREINQSVGFPFLVHMKNFIETELYFIMVLDYCPGGELFNLQRKVVRFEEGQAKKYFVQVLLAIEYLHQKKILYRDLKPQNIMLDLGGHIKIADFGLAKISKEKSYSFCGSLQYMSPEVLTRTGHSFEVDYYCLGVLLYQMTVGCPPFYQPDSTDQETKHRILYQQVEFPNEVQVSQQLKHLIRGLLRKDSKFRLGHLAGTKEIKCHPWLGRINRQDYLSKKIQMPYPVDLDHFNFDSKDITVSANRMLNNIRTNYAQKKNKAHNSLYNKKPNKILSPYREDNTKIKKMFRNNSTQKIKQRPLNEVVGKKNSGPVKKVKDKYSSIKACYSNSNLHLLNFFRCSTEACQQTKIKERRSKINNETESKQNSKSREVLKKRKKKQEFAFLQVKRH